MENPVGDDYAKRTERIKNLLSSYYGVEGSDGQPSPRTDAEPQPSLPNLQKNSYAPAATGIDSPAFNPDKHIAQILRSFNLDRLLSEHNNMSREIKNLDSDMQQLVYENYNKFIAATDTIRTMKSNVDSMVTDMEKLKTMIGESTLRNTSLHERHPLAASPPPPAAMRQDLAARAYCMPAARPSDAPTGRTGPSLTASTPLQTASPPRAPQSTRS
jgi:hypothetical protein